MIHVTGRDTGRPNELGNMSDGTLSSLWLKCLDTWQKRQRRRLDSIGAAVYRIKSGSVQLKNSPYVCR